jgi:2-methylisocitrate lyase-like PEP mutase family enzyme
MTQSEKAALFKSLHQKGNPLVLYNIWDAGGAQALADAGAKAVATGSWSVAAAHGFDDGEAMPLDFVLQIVERFTQSVALPVSVDFEGGYATAPADITTNVRRVIRAGAIGINIEDRVVQGSGLYPVDAQVARLKAVRVAAQLEGIPLFINARTDLFLGSDPATHGDLLGQALARADAYAGAGADGFFIPGLTAHSHITHIANNTDLPVNVMMMGNLNALHDAAHMGVSRASYGPGAYRTATTDLAQRFAALA